MNTTNLTESSNFEVPLSPLRFYLAGAVGVETALEILDGDGMPLPANRWVRDSSSWILDPMGLGTCSLRVVARAVNGATYPARATVQCTIVVGGQQFLGVFEDMAGRSSRDVVLLEVHSGTIRLRRAPRYTTVRPEDSDTSGVVAHRAAVQVFVDGSASMRTGRTVRHLSKAVGALQDLIGTNGATGELRVSWHSVRDGATHSVPDQDPYAALLQEPVSVGSVFVEDLFTAKAHYVVITDEVPLGLDRWTTPDGSTIQVLVIGSVASMPQRSTVGGTSVYEDDAGPESTALIAELASGLGWDE